MSPWPGCYAGGEEIPCVSAWLGEASESRAVLRLNPGSPCEMLHHLAVRTSWARKRQISEFARQPRPRRLVKWYKCFKVVPSLTLKDTYTRTDAYTPHTRAHTCTPFPVHGPTFIHWARSALASTAASTTAAIAARTPCTAPGRQGLVGRSDISAGHCEDCANS